MDSEEEYMSNMSSDDEIMQEYSADELSAGEGRLPPSSFAKRSAFALRSTKTRADQRLG